MVRLKATPAPLPTSAPMVVPLPKLAGEGTLSKVAAYDAAAAVQQRLIVRTVDMILVVEELPRALDATDALARELGGWVVQSSR